ncbi:MAG: hypothetical protein IPP51_13380 [Bacteroidetes bacterium]|nr:hypothetical protein [Bacteroidota bacterium]
MNDTSLIITVGNGGGGGGMCLSAGPSVGVSFVNIPGNVNANSPTSIQVAAVDMNGCNDTTFTGNITISKLNGPGNVAGSLSAAATHGIANFSVQFDQAGLYQLFAQSSGLLSDTSININVNSGGGGGTSGCPPTSTQGSRTNLGLYGGSSLDLTWNYSNKRLFAAISSPASLSYTDDTCKTWYRAFPDDSLEYGWVMVGGTCSTRTYKYEQLGSGTDFTGSRNIKCTCRKF